MGKSAKPPSMGSICIVEAWIFGLCGVEVTIEAVGFHTDFKDEVTDEKLRKVLRVGWRWMWEEVVVDEVRNRILTLHDDEL
jgi:hypothetical protein